MNATLSKIRAIINDALTLEEGLACVVGEVKQLLAVDACSVYLLDASHASFVLFATDGLDPRAIGAVRFALGEGLVGWVAETQGPVSLTNAQDHPRFRRIPQFGEKSHRAFLGVPISHAGHPLGVILVRQLNDRIFSDDEIAFLAAVALELESPAYEATGDPTVSATDISLRGIKVSPGVGIGVAILPSVTSSFDSIPDRTVDDAKSEMRAFKQAVAEVRAELRANGERIAGAIPSEARAMFGVYIELLDDDELFADTLERIRAGAWSCSALRRTIEDHVRVFEGFSDPYLRSRAEDIRGLGRRILIRLQAGKVERPDYGHPCVLIGEEISIARMAEVPVANLAGIVCSQGSLYSHSAILAKTLGVPAVMGIGNVGFERFLGHQILVDGDHGRVYIDPSSDLVRRRCRVATRHGESNDVVGLPQDGLTETADGWHIALQANVGLIGDLPVALKAGAEGVGLFRTEFSFMVRESFPSEEEQYQTYREALVAFSPKTVTMRTLDVGGDKALSYFPMQEENSFLGWRGIRFTLDNPGIFLTQLRALLRANSGLGNLQILLPMVSGTQELTEVRDLLNRAATECVAAGHPISIPDLGVMIEAPAAVYQIEALSKKADFFSIGTNDLTQYLLAVDRTNPRVARHFDCLHPAVIRAIDSVARSARTANRPVSVCGEMAGDPQSAVLLVGMGINALSMASSCIRRVKLAVGKFTRGQARFLARAAISAEDTQEVREILSGAFANVGLGNVISGHDPSNGITLADGVV